MKRFTYSIIICLFSTIISLIFIDLIFGKILENRFLGRSWPNWRNYEDNFTDTECYKLNDKMGFEPIWGNCTYPDLSKYKQTDPNNGYGIAAPREFRILVLGDSNTKRGGFDHSLESKLNDKLRPKNIKISVIKVGVESYNTRQEIDLLKAELLDLHPNMVVLQFTLNDFDFTPAVVKINNNIQYFSVQGEKSHEPNDFLFKYSHLYRIIFLRKILINKTDVPQNQDLQSTFWGDYFWDDKVATMKKNLDEFKGVLDSAKAQGVVLIYPIFDTSQWLRELNMIKGLLVERKIDYIDLLPMTAPYGGANTFQGTWGENQPDIIHPTREFDAIVEESLYKYILSNIDD